jgi:DNA-binding transcriptional regulator YiaG
MDVSVKLKAWRGADALGRGAFTQVEAAEFLGVPFRTYQDWELGRSCPTGMGLASLLETIRRNRRPQRSKVDVREIKLGRDN